MEETTNNNVIRSNFMTPQGKQIRIFLPDTSVNGVRYAELVNWTGQAVVLPRVRISELQSWPECSRPGVYFLLESRFADITPCAYIGEAENVALRIVNHDKNKEFWSEVIIFTSKDENLTKSHIKYMESAFVTMAKKAARYSLENANSPTESSLPRADRAAMDEFIENSRMILGVLGHPVLEPILAKNSSKSLSSSDVLFETDKTSDTDESLLLEINDCLAYGNPTDEGFVLRKGSRVTLKNAPSLPTKYARLKESLIEDGAFVMDGLNLISTRDVAFSSSSMAATIVAGHSRSGPNNWHTREGRSLKSIEEEQFARTHND